MAKKTPLDKLKKCAKEVDRLSELQYKAKEKQAQALDAYADSVADEVAELLKALEWGPAKGRGSRGMLRALVPQRHRLIAIYTVLSEYSNYAWSQTFGRLAIHFNRRYTGMYVDVSKSDLKIIGVELRKQKVNVDRRKMVKMLKRKGVTPEQLQAMLNEKAV